MNTEKELLEIRNAANWFLPQGAIIAGGALTSAFTSTPINDVDIYFKSKDAFIEAVRDAYDDGLWCTHLSKRAVTFAQGKKIVQLMFFDWFDCAEDIFDAFDFTINMAAYDIDFGSFIFHDEFMKHNASRMLKFSGKTKYPFGTVTRVKKYEARGYTIGKGDLIRIALRCSEIPMTNWDEFKDAIGGKYGDSLDVSYDGDFSIDAAISAIEETDFSKIKVRETRSMPSNADDLLLLIFGE